MKSYRPMGLFPMQSGSGLPKRTGLFGSLLSMASLNSIGDQERASFEFKASYYGRNRMMAEGLPYDYRNDPEYGTKVHWWTSEPWCRTPGHSGSRRAGPPPSSGCVRSRKP